MILFNVGTNFDVRVLEKAVELNERYKDDGLKIHEFYGSLPGGTARPNFRIPEIRYLDLKEYIKECHSNGIRFNYTLNSPLTDYWFSKRGSEFKDLAEMLIDLNVDIVTIAHMIPLQYLNDFCQMEISTIMEVQSIEAIKRYINRFNVEKICLAITKNRDLSFLRALKKHGLHAYSELLVNEFCNIEGIPCQNFYRKSCYDLHALGGNQNNEKGGYPLKICSASRYQDDVSWIKANVIFPWDVSRYEQVTGIHNYKISGRTLPTEYINYIMEAYMSRGLIMDDNILSLWGHVDKVEKPDKTVIPKVYISAETLKSIRFLDFFIDTRIDCQKADCTDCGYCDDVLKKAIR